MEWSPNVHSSTSGKEYPIKKKYGFKKSIDN